jgi:hypothetical protein
MPRRSENDSSEVAECYPMASPTTQLGGFRGYSLFPDYGSSAAGIIGDAWVSRWDDLIDFEIVPVLTSADFWAKTQLE